MNFFEISFFGAIKSFCGLRQAVQFFFWENEVFLGIFFTSVRGTIVSLRLRQNRKKLVKKTLANFWRKFKKNFFAEKGRRMMFNECF